MGPLCFSPTVTLCLGFITMSARPYWSHFVAWPQSVLTLNSHIIKFNYHFNSCKVLPLRSVSISALDDQQFQQSTGPCTGLSHDCISFVVITKSELHYILIIYQITSSHVCKPNVAAPTTVQN